MKKIKENVKKLLSHFKSGFERFPITIILTLYAFHYRNIHSRS